MVTVVLLYRLYVWRFSLTCWHERITVLANVDIYTFCFEKYFCDDNDDDDERWIIDERWKKWHGVNGYSKIMKAFAKRYCVLRLLHYSLNAPCLFDVFSCSHLYMTCPALLDATAAAVVVAYFCTL